MALPHDGARFMIAATAGSLIPPKIRRLDMQVPSTASQRASTPPLAPSPPVSPLRTLSETAAPGAATLQPAGSAQPSLPRSLALTRQAMPRRASFSAAIDAPDFQ